MGKQRLRVAVSTGHVFINMLICQHDDVIR